jgi:opacity protein-like surface antigen
MNNIQKLKQHAITPTIICSAFMFSLEVAKAQSESSSTNSPNSPFTAEKISKSAYPDIWQNGVGEGFNSGVQSVQLGLAAGYGVQMLGSRQSHDLILGDLAYGYTLGSVEGEGHWYRGNWELRMELFGGSQFSPVNATLVGITPHLRYYFMTGTRWVPFLDAGAGLTGTTIGGPDLSDTFEFNLQATAGVRWFVRDNLALGIEARYLHISCAGLHSPNLGLNNVGGMVNITWFF